RRWYAAIKDLSQQDFERTVIHPEQGREMSLWLLLGLYVWHGKHHTAHIISLKERMNW
ncbi:MAG: metal-dependent hydrolase, partial [Hydrotalea flava]|nr:metal-dependent hydrolase [Hydrotalea flava]NIM37499.1 metal-dependent hydrolase [Hydrotalea flava]NIN02671.1 metal-dependent hydrolase [Hydrotalea flava]NIN14342.1 metal-dependent hydrolase [Hydrotalea flava]NIO93425.1 metal-dependent hydrolase [Hydrotalea flava]